METLHVVNLLYKLPEEVKHFAALTILRIIIYTAVNIFLPAYVVYTYNLKIALLYLALQYFFFYTFISANIFKIFSKKYSIETIQIISTILGICGILVVFLIKNIFGLFISALFLNLNFALYWLSRHYVVVGFAKKKDFMEESVFIDITGRIVQFVLPLISSYIIYSLGYNYYYAFITFLILNFIVYVMRKMKRKRTYFPISHSFTSSFMLLFLLEGVICTGWLLSTTALLFYNIKLNIKFYGILKSVAQILIITLSFYIAKIIDNKHNLRISMFSLAMLPILYIFYIFVKSNPLLIAITVTLISIFYNLGGISSVAFLYEYARKYDPSVILSREVLLSVSRFFIILLFVYTQDVMIFVGFLSFIYLFLFYNVVSKYKHLLKL